MKNYYYLVFKEDDGDERFVKLTAPTKMMDREIKELINIFAERCIKNCDVVTPSMVMHRLCSVMGSGWEWEDWTEPIIIDPLDNYRK